MIENELLHYGYLFVFLGTIVEGDATLLTAAFLAHRGYFRFSLVLLIAALTTIVASQIYFLTARRAGAKMLDTMGARGGKTQRIIAWSHKHAGLLLVASRFMIGFRTLIPVICGATGMGTMRFAIWNAAGAGIWTAVFGAVGYLGGQALSIFFKDIRNYEKPLAAMMALAIISLILWLTHGRELYQIWTLRRALAATGGDGEEQVGG